MWRIRWDDAVQAKQYSKIKKISGNIVLAWSIQTDNQTHVTMTTVHVYAEHIDGVVWCIHGNGVDRITQLSIYLIPFSTAGFLAQG